MQHISSQSRLKLLQKSSQKNAQMHFYHGLAAIAGVSAGEEPDAEDRAHYEDPEVLAEVSRDLGTAMAGIDAAALPESERLQSRGW